MKHFLILLCITILFSVSLHAQKTIVNVPSDPPGASGNLNNAIQAAISGGTLSNTTFNLELYGYYVLTGVIIVPLGEHLEIVAPDPGTTQLTSPPQILWTADDAVSKDFMFQCLGDLTMKNIWLRYADEGGVQVSSQIRFIGDTLGTSQVRGTFDNVIFDYSPTPQAGAGGSVTVTANHFVGNFTNCYWKNCIDTHLRYYGRAVSFPYSSTKWHNDSVNFENCTFANMGYVYMQEGQEYGDNVHFNHCTFLNVVQFTLESGWWYKMSVTNSIHVNTFMYGNNPAQTGTGDPNGGTIRIDSIATTGFPIVSWTEQDRRILFANNNYHIEQWLVDWMRNNPYSDSLHKKRLDSQIPVPQPMLSPATLVFFDSVVAGVGKLFPYMNKANLYDGVNPEFVTAPTNLDALKLFLQYKWSYNQDINWAYEPDDGWNQLWPLRENLAYSNATLKTAAMGGFPLGDLYRWWPAEYVQWKAQEQAEHARITTWLETGIDPAVGVREVAGMELPSIFTLGQNYPNPFNPNTQIEYSVPKTGNISLKVYDLLGEEVATIFEGSQKAGNYIAEFNGSELTSGVYLYRLQSEGVSISKKFILMR